MARRLGVSRDDVVAAALRVCDRVGVEELTVSAVADEIGCRPPSIYHHVDGLAGVLRAITFVAVEQLLGVLEAAAEASPPAQQLPALANAARAWAVAHPARFDLLRRREGPGIDAELGAARAQLLLPVQDAMIALGVPVAERARLVATLVAAVRGCMAADVDACVGPDKPAVQHSGHDDLLRLAVEHVLTAADGPADAQVEPVATTAAEPVVTAAATREPATTRTTGSDDPATTTP